MALQWKIQSPIENDASSLRHSHCMGCSSHLWLPTTTTTHADPLWRIMRVESKFSEFDPEIKFWHNITCLNPSEKIDVFSFQRWKCFTLSCVLTYFSALKTSMLKSFHFMPCFAVFLSAENINFFTRELL